jgi:hypothetical protein
MEEEHAAKVAMALARRIEALALQVSALWSTVAEIRAANPITPPSVREMITSALEYAAPTGLTRAGMIRAIQRDYGVTVSDNTLTGTLSRMHVARLIRRNGQTWFLKEN